MINRILRALDSGAAAFLEEVWPMPNPPKPDGADELTELEAEEEVAEPYDREAQVRADGFGGVFGDQPIPREPMPHDLDKTIDLLLTVLIGKGIISPGIADYIQTGIPYQPNPQH